MGTVIVGDSVDGEMCVDQSHLVEEALCDTDDHVLDQGLDGPEAGNVLSGTVPDGELDFSLLGGVDLGLVWF